MELINILSAILLVILGVLSAYEYALLNLNHNRIYELAKDGNYNASVLVKITETPEKHLIGIQFAKTIIMLVVSINVLERYFDTFWVLIVAILCLAFVMLLCAEFIPKHLVARKATEVALMLALPVNYFTMILRPVAFILDMIVKLMLKVPGLHPPEESVTEEEIRMIVDAGAESGNINVEEIEMINNVFEFNDKPVGDIAVHRKNIVAISLQADKQEIIDTLLNDMFSRIPIYDGNLDNIVGVLFVKDLIKVFCQDLPDKYEFSLEKLMRKPFFVPSSKKSDELFKEMQKNKTQIAIVFDEYGGNIGLVTMEDLIEEIMGNIFDEYDDEEEPDIMPIQDEAFVIKGETPLQDVSAVLDFELPEEEHDTLSGFVVAQLGYIPVVDENPTVMFENIIFKVLKVSQKRIVTVFVCKVRMDE